MRFASTSIIGLGLAVVLVGCGSSEGDQTAESPATDASEAVAAAPSTGGDEPSPSDSSPESESSEASSTSSDPVSEDETPAGSVEAESDATSGSSVLGPDKRGQQLGLADFFDPDPSWTESRYDVAGQTDVRGIATDINNCGPRDYDDSNELEMRLGRNFETMSFKVGQADNSEASDQTLVARVEGNNKQVDIWRIPFDQVQDFSFPVDQINALTVDFYLDNEVDHCGRSGSVQAVMYDVELQ